MQLRSLGHQTDLIFPRFDGLILDRGDYLVICTPANPAFYWGNFLLFAAPPCQGDLVRWRQAVKSRPAVQRGVALGKQDRRQSPPTDEERRILFGQKG